MEFVFEQCISGLKKLWTFVTNISSLEHDMKSLTEIKGELRAQELDVMAGVKAEEKKPGRKRRREVAQWLGNVKRFKREVDGMQEQLRNERGWISRYHLTNQISGMKTKAVLLEKKGRFPGRFPDCLAIDRLGISSPQPLATLQGESAKTALESIENHLSGGVIRKLGVCGPPGVGKTIILKNIYTKLKGLDDFKHIIWVPASKACNLHVLQREIASALQLDLPIGCDNEENISLQLHAEFSRREGCLLILDDLFKPFSLDKIGFPEPNSTNGFKVVVTTRSVMVCENMESEEIVKVGLLSAKEAWDLLKKKVGGGVLDSSEIKSIAERIIEECDCLPLAIITVGRRLSGVRDIRMWRNALDEFRRPNTDIYGMDEVFDLLKISYMRLRNDRIRDCFLHCASYPQDNEMSEEQLIVDWFRNGLIDEVEKIEQSKDMGYAILQELVGTCMIVKSDDKPGVVKLPHLMRLLAVSIKTSPHS